MHNISVFLFAVLALVCCILLSSLVLVCIYAHSEINLE